MHFLDPDDTSRFAPFTILTKTYKTIQNHPITIDIIYPKTLTEAPALTARPLILRFHGGGLVTGSSLFPPFFAPWILQLAEQHSAVIVSPNYRLIPEATVRDALNDVEDAWEWMRTILPSVLQQEAGIAVDLDRILTTGDSAGGYLSLQIGLSHADKIRAVTASYPSADVYNEHFVGESTKEVFGLPTVPRNTIAEHMEEVRAAEAAGAGKVIVSADPRLERGKLMWCMVQNGLFGEFFPAEQRNLSPFKRLEDGARFPRGGVVVWHGKEDSVVPVESSYKLKEILERVDPELGFKLDVREGEHGFDHAVSLDDEWVQESLKGVVDAWLA